MPFPSCKVKKMYHKDTLMSYFDVATESSSGKCHTHRSDEKVKAVSPDFILNHKSKILGKKIKLRQCFLLDLLSLVSC